MTQPTRLLFEIGGFMGEGVVITLRRGQLLCGKTLGPLPAGRREVIRPSEEQWQRFWQEVERIGVWQWRTQYIDERVCDGTQWLLDLCHAGRTIRCEGSNAYPGSAEVESPSSDPFAAFVGALAQLAGRPDLVELLEG